MKIKLINLLIILVACEPAFAVLSVDSNTPKTITADKIEYDVKSKTISTIGKTEIKNENGQTLKLNNSNISKTDGTFSGNNIELWLGSNVYVFADSIEREDNMTIAKDAKFTVCYDCDKIGNAWEIHATTIKQNNYTHMLYFRNPVLWIYNTVPVLWLPYYQMPDPSVKHKTGILMPDLQSTNNMGTQINLPVYISISDSHDLTATLSYLTKENPLFQLEHRLNIAHGEFRTNGSFTHNREGKDRWAIFHNDVFELGQYARASVFLERTSDKTYLQKYGFENYKPYLDSGARVELFGQTSYAVADAHIFQDLTTSGTYERGNVATISGNVLPNIRGVYQTNPFFKETYALFNADVLGVAGDQTDMQRLIGDARIVSPWTLWGGNRVTVSLDARYDIYNFNKNQMIDNTQFTGIKSRFLPSGYVEWGLPLFNPSENWTHIIEPRARLTIMPHLDNELFLLNNDSAGALLSDAILFSDNRFSGFDLWENGTFADYGAQWSAFNMNNNVSVFVGQSYDFIERADTDPNSGFHNGASDFVGRVEYSNLKWIDFKTRFRLARNDFSLNHIETSAKIGTARNYINIGHIWTQQFIDLQTRDDDINELMAGIGVQVTDRISLRFDSIYNATLKKFQQHSGGIYYNHPCYYLALSYRRDNAVKEDYVGNTTFQFKFGIAIDGQQY